MGSGPVGWEWDLAPLRLAAMKTGTGKWLVAGALLLALVSGVSYLQARPRPLPDAKFAALSQREKNLAIYDTFRAQLEEHYFDSKLMESPEWDARFDEWREKAAAAPTGIHLYTDVFYKLLQLFPSSHVDVLLPSPAGGSTSPTATAPAPKSDRIEALLRSGPGFDLISIRRGSKRGAVVGDVIAGSPADRAGIEPGWAVGTWSFNMDVASESARFKGEFLRLSPEHASAYERDLTVNFPDAKTLEQGEAAIAANQLTIEYDYEVLPRIEPIDTRILEGGVTYLRFDSFGETALIDRVLGIIDSAGSRGLIVDLRHNHGGQAAEMRRVLGRLLGNDAYIGTVRAGRRYQNLRTEKKGPHYPGPIAVLIGPATSSAAEIAAAAVLDNKRGILIGRMTNGSVLSSKYFPLGGGWQAFIPMYDYVRGGDRRIEGIGVEPDIRVMPTLGDVRAGLDPVTERALAELRK